MASDAALRALNRFGLGARVGERARIGDARGWLRAQLQGAPPELPAPASAVPADIAAALRTVGMRAVYSEEVRQQARRRLVGIAEDESRAALTQRVASERPFVERLVAFWSNHLCVSAGAKRVVAPLAGGYERQAVRPHVLGRFEDMVLASARHPAMLFYLDNHQSIGPSSPAGGRARRGARRGLNENYARELLELHTLGVDGGYAQADVVELARILTGWTVAGLYGPGTRRPGRDGDAPGPLRFAFRPAQHEPGPKTLLGRRYPEAGVNEGEQAIRALCRHPSTATFVATKLVAHFVADQPPPSAVERVAGVFRDSEGDLRAVSTALVELPEAWSEGTRKFRTPQDWLVAALRALGAPGAGENLAGALRQLRHPLWSPAAPKGFGDTMQDWADPDALLNRAELARTLGRRMAGAGPDPRALAEVVEAPAANAMRAMLADNRIAPAERIALAIAAPAFQWR
ncbi:DUF1800 domain-containing protein [Longimicrobium sp.]|jgi:uncharacterized protein (DUF1800 family)|uniref:DUF1800 domain-containing protein n=1 Tax=Longimicrobium sp. TaxID=2029185 RepID=UPI002ED9AA7A